MIVHIITQVLLAILSLIAIWLSQDENVSKRKYACLFGLASQPLWMYTSYVASQWGVFVLSFVYTAVWLKGLKTHWFETRQKNKKLYKRIVSDEAIDRAWAQAVKETGFPNVPQQTPEKETPPVY